MGPIRTRDADHLAGLNEAIVSLGLVKGNGRNQALINLGLTAEATQKFRIISGQIRHHTLACKERPSHCQADCCGSRSLVHCGW
jgi:hypothetical protein